MEGGGKHIVFGNQQTVNRVCKKCNWDPLDNEVEGCCGNEDCKAWKVSKTTVIFKMHSSEQTHF